MQRLSESQSASLTRHLAPLNQPTNPFLSALNFVYALFTPLGFLIAVNTLRRVSSQKHESTYLAFAISLMLTPVITDIIKNAVGRPRPDLLARCQPSSDAPTDIPVDISVCTTDPNTHLLQDGWRSFPSGHSSFAFAGLGFTGIWLAGQLHVFHHHGKRDLPRALLCMVPLLGAALIAISRCEDYRHDVYDVTVGSALGMLVAWWSYRRHWPPLSSSRCSEPYPPPGEEQNLEDEQEPRWQRVRDEEERGVDHVGTHELNSFR